MANVFDYIFNIGGNYSATINGMSAATGNFTAKVEGAQKGFNKWISNLAGVDLFKNAIDGLQQAVDALGDSGISLDSNMHDLSAVAGVTGDTLKQIEQFARESAKTFGTDASVAVEGYKLLLSQLSPELAKTPAVLREMGDCIQTTSKLMEGDGAAAAQVLTTAMNQYGVSLEDPTAASREMARMMNVMAAAGQAGSAELPAISAALQQCGMAAKAAGVSFEETNAAIQVLDKAGKKASEGGVALRNVMGQLSKGRFVEKQAAEELQKAGIDIVALADNSKSLKERLEMLKPMLNDSALLSKFFGVENANAARALIQGTDALEGFTQAVTGTNSATDQAAVIMQSYAERQAVVNQKIEDFKITLFQATGDTTLWAGAIIGLLTPLVNLAPLLMALGKMMLWIRGLNWAGMWQGVQRGIYVARLQMAIMNKELATGKFVSNGFVLNMGRATMAVVRFATVGLFQALKGLGALVLSMVTGGTASSAFAGVATASFGAFKLAATTACRAVSVAIMSIPIVGWIVAGITAIVALGVYFWNTSVTFRAVLKGLGAAFVATFTGIADLACNVFGAIGDLIRAVFALDGNGIRSAIAKLGGAFVDYGAHISRAFSDAYHAEIERSEAENKDEEEAAGPQTPPGMPEVPALPEVPDVAAPDPTAGSLGTVSGGGGQGGGKIHNVTVNVDKLVERFEIHTTNMAGDMSRVKEMVSQALLSALNDVNLAV